MKRDKNIGNFLVRSAFQASDYSELLNAHVHDAKQVLSFAKLRKQRDPSELSRSLIISPVPQSMSTAQLALFAKSYTSGKQRDD